MIRFRHRINVWLARGAAAVSLLATIFFAAIWVRSYRQPQAWMRQQWELSAAVDEWWTSHFFLADGVAVGIFSHETAPAFVGQVVGAGGAISPDRVTPSGVTWLDLPSMSHGVFRNDAPPIFGRLGVAWEHRNPTAGSSAMFPADRWSVQVRLGLPTAMAGALTIACALWSHRAGRPGRRARKGLCAACGYDLRGSPQRCPECGRGAGANA